jgi:hypothetical protein
MSCTVTVARENACSPRPELREETAGEGAPANMENLGETTWVLTAQSLRGSRACSAAPIVPIWAKTLVSIRKAPYDEKVPESPSSGNRSQTRTPHSQD